MEIKEQNLVSTFLLFFTTTPSSSPLAPSHTQKGVFMSHKIQCKTPPSSCKCVCVLLFSFSVFRFVLISLMSQKQSGNGR